MLHDDRRWATFPRRRLHAASSAGCSSCGPPKPPRPGAAAILLELRSAGDVSRFEVAAIPVRCRAKRLLQRPDRAPSELVLRFATVERKTLCLVRLRPLRYLP